LGIEYRRYGWYRPNCRVGKVHIKNVASSAAVVTCDKEFGDIK